MAYEQLSGSTNLCSDRRQNEVLVMIAMVMKMTASKQ
jgi:hypothetical protein